MMQAAPRYLVRNGTQVLTAPPCELQTRTRRSVLVFHNFNDAAAVREVAAAGCSLSWSRSGGVYLLRKPPPRSGRPDRKGFNVHACDPYEDSLYFGHTHMDMFCVTSLAVPSTHSSAEVLMCGYTKDTVRIGSQPQSYKQTLMQYLLEHDEVHSLVVYGEDQDDDDGYELVAQGSRI